MTKGSVSGEAKPIAPDPLLSDSFAENKRAGRVIGSRTPTGVERRGVDREGVISIDNGALRIQPLLEPGWGRAGVSYGPYSRANGLAFAVFMVNGHNTAQSENLRETFRDRFQRWLVGPETFRRRHRLMQWLRSTRKLRTLRQWRWWHRISKDAPAVPQVNENLALGWFANDATGRPLSEGNGFVMHATGPENGELWARVGDGYLPAVRSVQNLQIYYVVVLRESGAVYYASSVPGANGLGQYPQLRPLAIDPFNAESEIYAGVQQAALGQIGFRLDTRIYGMRVARIRDWSAWHGTAHAADTLKGNGRLQDCAAETGGIWQQLKGEFVRTPLGIQGVAPDNLALLGAPAPTGLVHVLIHSGSGGVAVSLVWRFAGPGNHWKITVDSEGCILVCSVAGEAVTLARSDAGRLKPRTQHSLQVLDDGRRISLHLDGMLLFGERFTDERLSAATGVGVAIAGRDDETRLQMFEAHPRNYRVPTELDMGSPWWRLGQRIVVSEDFEGPEGDLEGKRTTTGDRTWQRTIGIGRIQLTGHSGARIDATAKRPNPGRTAYTFDWPHSDFVDLEVEITPPGSEKGQGEHGLCGFVLWQDPRNYITLNIWRCDAYDGASISTFFQLNGFEDLYDAIWSNVGNRVYWGQPHRLRLAFDGMHYMALVNDEPVLYRALTDVYPDARRLMIRRVGLLANWEWGDDTGSVFRSFRARV
jgi:hypothetical protein